MLIGPFIWQKYKYAIKFIRYKNYAFKNPILNKVIPSYELCATYPALLALNNTSDHPSISKLTKEACELATNPINAYRSNGGLGWEL